MKKIIIIFLIILLIPGLIFGMYKFIEFLDRKSSISNLNDYLFVSNEQIVKELEYNNNKYIISKYYDSTSSWSHLNILLKEKDKFYMLKNIKKCDVADKGKNIYIKDNIVYIHCIGKIGNVDKYIIDKFNVKSDTLKFNYQNTPNISQIHIGIDNVDDDYIYLSSPFKVDNTIKNDPKVKCSFEDKICRYYI